MNDRPRFFIVGAQRCGTTYLYTMLDDHPDICMARPVRPEPKFFLNDDLYRRGQAWYENQYFPGIRDGQVAGEKSTSYFESETAARRIRKHYPDAKIVISLRNPVDRALSNYRFSVANGLETRTPEEVFLEGKPAPDLQGAQVSVSPFDYLGRSDYRKFIETYLRIFPPAQVRFMILEEYRNDPDRLRELYGFLGADSGFVPAGQKRKVNASAETIPVSAKVTEKLTAVFMPGLELLAQTIGRDLSPWCR